jgi:8-oxo-dGTP pyrophosphatase MutT (NUDIX family)
VYSPRPFRSEDRAPRVLAVGLCIRPSDGALLVEHGHDRVTGQRFFRAIGGGLEPGEGPADAVVREWREEFALAVHVVRALGTIDNRFVYEGTPGHEEVTILEVVPDDPAIFAFSELEGHDLDGQLHSATWVDPEAFRSDALALFPTGVLDLLRSQG